VPEVRRRLRQEAAPAHAGGSQVTRGASTKCSSASGASCTISGAPWISMALCWTFDRRWNRSPRGLPAQILAGLLVKGLLPPACRHARPVALRQHGRCLDHYCRTNRRVDWAVNAEGGEPISFGGLLVTQCDVVVEPQLAGTQAGSEGHRLHHGRRLRRRSTSTYTSQRRRPFLQ
jgi:hypothetical protein